MKATFDPIDFDALQKGQTITRAEVAAAMRANEDDPNWGLVLIRLIQMIHLARRDLVAHVVRREVYVCHDFEAHVVLERARERAQTSLMVLPERRRRIDRTVLTEGERLRCEREDLVTTQLRIAVSRELRRLSK